MVMLTVWHRLCSIYKHSKLYQILSGEIDHKVTVVNFFLSFNIHCKNCVINSLFTLAANIQTFMCGSFYFKSQNTTKKQVMCTWILCIFTVWFCVECFETVCIVWLTKKKHEQSALSNWLNSPIYFELKILIYNLIRFFYSL